MGKLAQTNAMHWEYCAYMTTPRRDGIQAMNHMLPMKSMTLSMSLPFVLPQAKKDTV